MNRYLSQLFADEPAQPEPAAGQQTEPSGNEPAANEPQPAAKYTDEDLDKIINQRFARWQAQQKKATEEAARLASMSAQEKAEAEKAALQQELDEYKRKDALAEMSKTARKILADDGVSISDELLGSLVSTNADETRAHVKAFAEMYKAAVQEGVKNALKSPAPRTGSGTTVTKESIMKIADRAERQAQIKAHPEIFGIKK